MDSRQLTSLLSFITDAYEVNCYMRSKIRLDFIKKKLLDKFPNLTKVQVKHILRII